MSFSNTNRLHNLSQAPHSILAASSLACARKALVNQAPLRLTTKPTARVRSPNVHKAWAQKMVLFMNTKTLIQTYRQRLYNPLVGACCGVGPSWANRLEMSSGGWEACCCCGMTGGSGTGGTNVGIGNCCCCSGGCASGTCCGRGEGSELCCPQKAVSG